MKPRARMVIGLIAVGLLATGVLLLIIAANKPDLIDASGMLIEPFADLVVGAGLTTLGVALLAVRYFVRKRP